VFVLLANPEKAFNGIAVTEMDWEKPNDFYKMQTVEQYRENNLWGQGKRDGLARIFGDSLTDS
jgi:hypothetical protein